jgi:hypothetical protein
LPRVFARGISSHIFVICLTPSVSGYEMAKNKESQESTDGVLVTAAKTIGAAAGKIAAAVGVATPAKPKVPKLVKKHKDRLPRRQKKAAKKALKPA